MAVSAKHRLSEDQQAELIEHLRKLREEYGYSSAQASQAAGEPPGFSNAVANTGAKWVGTSSLQTLRKHMKGLEPRDTKKEEVELQPITDRCSECGATHPRHRAECSRSRFAAAERGEIPRRAEVPEPRAVARRPATNEVALVAAGERSEKMKKAAAAPRWGTLGKKVLAELRPRLAKVMEDGRWTQREVGQRLGYAGDNPGTGVSDFLRGATGLSKPTSLRAAALVLELEARASRGQLTTPETVPSIPEPVGVPHGRDMGKPSVFWSQAAMLQRQMKRAPEPAPVKVVLPSEQVTVKHEAHAVTVPAPLPKPDTAERDWMGDLAEYKAELERAAAVASTVLSHARALLDQAHEKAPPMFKHALVSQQSLAAVANEKMQDAILSLLEQVEK